MGKAKAEKAEAPQAETRAPGGQPTTCPTCGASVIDMTVHNEWHESQQVKYTELQSFHAPPEATPQGEAVLTAPPVEAPEVAPQAVTWTNTDPNATTDTGLAIIHVPK